MNLLNTYTSFFAMLLIASSFFAYSPPAKEKTTIFRGEKMVYNVSYGFINAGEVMVSVDSQFVKVDSNICFKAEITARTKGVAGFFSKINDVWISYIDSASFLSYRFVRNQQENNYTLRENTEFDRSTKQALVTRMKENNAFELKTYPISANVQDMVSAYFGLRSNQGEKLRTNDTVSFDVFLEDTTFHLQMKYLGKERLRTKLGKIKAYKFSPIIPHTKNSVLSDENPILTWISADEYRIPLKIKVNTKYGDVEANIEEYRKGY